MGLAILIRSVLRLRPRPDGHRDVLDLYARNEILDRALTDGGCASVELQVRLPGRDEVVVSALWRSVADYEAWARNPARAQDVGEIEELLAPGSEPLGTGDLYEVVVSLPEPQASLPEPHASLPEPQVALPEVPA